uniref:DUF834 domain-containing protein n=1 Tax=Oryza meridionalis TaxID=40149 RepID=A0A0E0E240_9ORYZ
MISGGRGVVGVGDGEMATSTGRWVRSEHVVVELPVILQRDQAVNRQCQHTLPLASPPPGDSGRRRRRRLHPSPASPPPERASAKPGGRKDSGDGASSYPPRALWRQKGVLLGAAPGPARPGEWRRRRLVVVVAARGLAATAAEYPARSSGCGGQISAGPGRIWWRGSWQRGVKEATAAPGGGRGGAVLGGEGGGVPPDPRHLGQIRRVAGRGGRGSWRRRRRLATAAEDMATASGRLLAAMVVEGDEAAAAIGGGGGFAEAAAGDSGRLAVAMTVEAAATSPDAAAAGDVVQSDSNEEGVGCEGRMATPRSLAVQQQRCSGGDRDCSRRRHGGLRRLAGGVAAIGGGVGGSLGAERRSRGQQAREARPAVRRPAWCKRSSRWRETGLAREARPVVKEAGVARGGAAGGKRRRSRCKEELPVDVARSSAHECWPVGGVDVVVPHVGRAVVEHRYDSRGLVGNERRVKTQPGLGRTDNDGSFPLLKVLSCRLIPQGWLLGESPVLALLSP